MSTIPVFDGHNDVLLAYHTAQRGESSFLERSDQGHLDFPRAKEGGFAGGFFAVYSPGPTHKDKAEIVQAVGGHVVPMSPPRNQQEALQDTLAMAAQLFRIERNAGGQFKVVRSVDELEHCLQTGVMAAIFHIEGAEAIDPKLEALEVLYQAGLRSIGPVWSRPNLFGSGVSFSFPLHPDSGDGLTPWGKDLVRLCDQLGIMVDLSHITAKGFWDVHAVSSRPLVATHSNAYALSNTARNLTDDQLAAIADTDGMVGLNFAVTFLREDGKREPATPLETMVRHIDYLVEKVGIDRVGFGSDFDGATIPEAMGDVTGLPKLVEALSTSGYDRESLEKICHKNWVRVLRKSWA